MHEDSIYETAMASLSLSKCSARFPPTAIAQWPSPTAVGRIPLETFGSSGMASSCWLRRMLRLKHVAIGGGGLPASGLVHARRKKALAGQAGGPPHQLQSYKPCGGSFLVLRAVSRPMGTSPARIVFIALCRTAGPWCYPRPWLKPF